MAETNSGRPPLPQGTAKQVVRMGVGRNDILRFQVVDTDIVATLKNGHKIVVPDGAVKTMLDPDFVISFKDGDVLGTDILQSSGPLQVNPVTTTTVGAPPDTTSVPASGTATSGTATAASSVAGSATSATTALATTAEVASKASGIASWLPWISAAGSLGGLAVGAGGGGGSSTSSGSTSTGVIIAPTLDINTIGSSMVISTTSLKTITGTSTDNTGPVALKLLGSNEAFATVDVKTFTPTTTTPTVYSWSYTFSDTDISTFTQGTNYIRASQTTSGGVTSVTSNTPFTVDTVVPTVHGVAVTGVTGVQNSTLNAGDTVSTTVSFSEAVVVSGAPKLALNIGGQSALASYASGSGTNALVFIYTIQPGDNDADGISIDQNSLQLNEGTIRDAAGNEANIDSGSATSDYLVDTTSPTISSIAITGATGVMNSRLNSGDTVTM